MSAAARLLTALPALLAMAAGGASAATLYDALGGQTGVHRITVGLVQRVRADARIQASFKDTDFRHLGMRLEQQLCAVADGPCTYGGKDMTTIHQDLAITDAQFNALVEDLQDALDAAGVPNADQNRLLARLAPMHRQIVTR
jgi:hemoglobin